jgi:O-antigen ligase
MGRPNGPPGICVKSPSLLIFVIMALRGRIPLWEIAFSQIQHHPWLGVGFAAFWNQEITLMEHSRVFR